MAWDLLTGVYGLPKDRLYVTYFEGDTSLGLEPDFEAHGVEEEGHKGHTTDNTRQLWRDMGLAEDHIIPGNTKDNFWGKTSIWAQLKT